MANPRSLPQFKDLPLQPNDPPHSAWGLYGSHDQLGTLNRLTDDVVADAARDEIKTGSRYVHRYPYKLRYIGVVCCNIVVIDNPVLYQLIAPCLMEY